MTIESAMVFLLIMPLVTIVLHMLICAIIARHTHKMHNIYLGIHKEKCSSILLKNKYANIQKIAKTCFSKWQRKN